MRCTVAPQKSSGLVNMERKKVTAKYVVSIYFVHMIRKKFHVQSVIVVHMGGGLTHAKSVMTLLRRLRKIYQKDACMERSRHFARTVGGLRSANVEKTQEHVQDAAKNVLMATCHCTARHADVFMAGWSECAKSARVPCLFSV